MKNKISAMKNTIFVIIIIAIITFAAPIMMPSKKASNRIAAVQADPCDTFEVLEDPTFPDAPTPTPTPTPTPNCYDTHETYEVQTVDYEFCYGDGCYPFQPIRVDVYQITRHYCDGVLLDQRTDFLYSYCTCG